MEFRFHCLVVRHISGRVTVAPVEHPEFAVHASTLDSALLDLQLALDDRISRAHPRNVARYAVGAEGEPLELRVPALRQWYGESHTTVPIKLMAWRRPTISGFWEVHIPRLHSRYWLDEASNPHEALGPTLLEVLKTKDDNARLGLVLGGYASFETITVESEPLRLSSLRPNELRLDARPFRSREEQAELDEAEEDQAKRRQRTRAEERRRRERERRRTPVLKSLAVALHTRSGRARIEPAWERDADVERLLAHVESDRPLPMVLVAPQGAGKTSLLEALALRMGAAGGPKARRARPVFALDASRLVAGAGGFGEWQSQLQTCLEEARRSGAVLLLGKIIELLDAGKHAYSDNNAAQMLAPALAAREVTVLGEATPEEWGTVQRRNASFASVWTPWQLDELSPEATKRVLDRVAAHLAKRASIPVLPGTVDVTLSLCRRFWPYGALVGNAVTFLRRLLSARAHDKALQVSPEDAIEFFSAEAGIPQVLLRDDVALDPVEVRTFLAARVMAQPQAVERAVQVVSTIKASLQDPRRPAAVLLFAGPTGVGKTELAKALAEFVFGSRERLIRIDMGEYLGHDALGRLLGDGDSAGLLPALVRRQPFCVLLLDELEKAHPAVFDALLGVLGEGRLSDARGRVTDFRNAIVIMTTNLGAETLRARVGFGADNFADAAAVRQHYLAEAQRFFRPEFFNRIDDLIVFRPLGADAIAAIVRREVGKLAQREGLLRRDIDLSIGDPALDALAREGLDPRLGARPLKRTIERRLSVPAASWLASHRQNGPTRFHVDLDPRNDTLRFRADALGRGAEGSRARAEQVLDEAADLRALFCRWDRSAALESLRGRLRLLEHSASTKGFWTDTALAEELSREAAQLRDLVHPMAELRRGVEAAEDLAVEAWYDRKSDTVETLDEELKELRKRFAPLPRKVYLSREHRFTSGILYLAAPRGAWSEMVSLCFLYQRWAQAHTLTCTTYVADYIEPAERPGTKPDDPTVAWKWTQRAVSYSEAPLPGAVALMVSGSPDAAFLDLETGGHRFAEGGDSIVRMRFIRADPKVTLTLRRMDALLPALKVDDVRRYSRSKQRVRDLRLDEDFELTLQDGGLIFDLEALHARWIERSCLGEEDIGWT